jgi:magnesium transporter
LLNVFTLVNGRLCQKEVDSLDHPVSYKPVWVDLDEPTTAEKEWVKKHFALYIPKDAIDEDIEESARFYEEDNGNVHIRTDFLIDDAEDPHAQRVAFILNLRNEDANNNDILFSIHDQDVPVFRLLRMRARRLPGFIQGGLDVLLKLFDADTEYCADSIEDVHDALEKISHHVLKGDVTDTEASGVLSTIARQEDLNSWIKRTMMDSRRAVSFLMRSRMLNSDQFAEARQILRDMESLDTHTAFLFDKVNFLMDATVGFININQNKIIKIFSVVSVALLPPTLIASIYGMNFRYMPELIQTWGYPYVLILMLLSALIPMLYFRKRGWLK